MIDPEVELPLSIAALHVHNALFAGSSRQTAAEAYSAIDAVFSALLIQGGEDPPRNHKAKFDRVQQKFPSVFDEHVQKLVHKHGTGTSIWPGVPWDAIERAYVEWLAARYGEYVATPAQSKRRGQNASSVLRHAIRYLAVENGREPAALETHIQELVFGHEFSKADEAVSAIHEMRFAEAERIGEERGSKLGMKLSATTNFCHFSLVSDDPHTQEIIQADEAIANACADLYARFVELIEDIHARRHEGAQPSDGSKATAEKFNDVPNYALALKFAFLGESMDETAVGFVELMGRFMTGIGKDDSGPSST